MSRRGRLELTGPGEPPPDVAVKARSAALISCGQLSARASVQ